MPDAIAAGRAARSERPAESLARLILLPPDLRLNLGRLTPQTSRLGRIDLRHRLKRERRELGLEVARCGVVEVAHSLPPRHLQELREVVELRPHLDELGVFLP